MDIQYKLSTCNPPTARAFLLWHATWGYYYIAFSEFVKSFVTKLLQFLKQLINTTFGGYC